MISSKWLLSGEQKKMAIDSSLLVNFFLEIWKLKDFLVLTTSRILSIQRTNCLFYYSHSLIYCFYLAMDLSYGTLGFPNLICQHQTDTY